MPTIILAFLWIITILLFVFCMGIKVGEWKLMRELEHSEEDEEENGFFIMVEEKDSDGDLKN